VFGAFSRARLTSGFSDCFRIFSGDFSSTPTRVAPPPLQFLFIYLFIHIALVFPLYFGFACISTSVDSGFWVFHVGLWVFLGGLFGFSCGFWGFIGLGCFQGRFGRLMGASTVFGFSWASGVVGPYGFS
jgi:hypothetical protein